MGSVDVFTSEVFTDTIPTFKFFTAFTAMLCATAPVSILGTRYAMSVIPFWTPEQFSERPYLPNMSSNLIKPLVPIVGMFCGNSISAIVVSIDYVLREFVCVPGAITTVALSTGS